MVKLDSLKLMVKLFLALVCVCYRWVLEIYGFGIFEMYGFGDPGKAVYDSPCKGRA